MWRACLWIIGVLSAAGNLCWMTARRGPPAVPAAQVVPVPAAAAPDRVSSDANAWKLAARAFAAFPNMGTPRELIARLREAGFGDDVIRSVIDAVLQRKYAVGPGGQVRLSDRYWERKFNLTTNGAPASALYQKELAEAVALLHGDDAEMAGYFGIPAGKMKAVLKMESDYGDLFAAVRSRRLMGPRLQSGNDELALLAREQAKDMAAILTPEEIKEYYLRVSGESYLLSGQLGPMRPTEREFRAIYTLRDDVDRQLRDLPADDPRRTAAETALQAQLRAALGESRYVDYQLTNSENGKSLYALTRRLELPDGAAREMHTLQTSLTAQADALRAQTSIDPDYRERQLALMAKNAETELKSRLGEVGYKAYLEFNGGWLKALSAPQKNPSP